MRLSFAAVTGVLLAACYTYAPLQTQPEPGAYLIVTLTASGSETLSRDLGPNVMVVRGRYVAASDGGLVISVASVETQRGDVLSWAGETVTLPAASVASVETRRLAKGQSALLAGASVAGLVATVGAFSLIGGGSSGGSGPPPTKK